MDNFKVLKLVHKVNNPKFNVLFLPGFPGGYKNRPIIEDLKQLGGNVYTISYPGTPGSNNSGIFSLLSTRLTIKLALTEINKQKLPKIIILYSYSTLFLSEITSFMNNTMAILCFSPIIDLKFSLKNNFVKDLGTLDKRLYTVNTESFQTKSKTLSESWKIYLERIKTLLESKLPIIFVYGGQDESVQSKNLYNMLYKYRSENRFNLAIQIYNSLGTHKLDTLYQKRILKPLLVAIVFSWELRNKFPNLSAYIMGSTINFLSRNKYSDIDIILIKSRWNIPDYSFMKKMAKTYYQKFGIKFDLSINTDIDCQSDKQIRSNRGPTFLHELATYFLPLYQRSSLRIMYSLENVIIDANAANRNNTYQSHKGLMNYHSGKFSPEMIIKNFIYSCIFDQYQKRNFIIDQNNLTQYYKSNKAIYSLISQILRIKKESYRNVSDVFLTKIVTLQTKLLKNTYNE